MNFFYSALLLLLLFVGCKKSVQTPTETTKKSDLSQTIKHKTYSVVKPSAKNMIANWKEYALVDDFLKAYENISPEEAFANTFELQELTKALKDSLNITALKTPAFKSRLNVFENEVLRLSDMSEIPAITSTEVNQQIDKVLLIYGSLNDKINTVYNQQKFEEEINLDSFFKLERDSIAKLKVDKNVKKKNNKVIKPED